jgi:hypothetical protein
VIDEWAMLSVTESKVEGVSMDLFKLPANAAFVPLPLASRLMSSLGAGDSWVLRFDTKDPRRAVLVSSSCEPIDLKVVERTRRNQVFLSDEDPDESLNLRELDEVGKLFESCHDRNGSQRAKR